VGGDEGGNAWGGGETLLLLGAGGGIFRAHGAGMPSNERPAEGRVGGLLSFANA
jgi:hypothetical protein